MATAGLQCLFSILPPNGPLLGRVTRCAFCWDGQSKTVKPRKPKPPGFSEDRIFFREVLERLFGCIHVTSTSESDDACATLAYRLADRGEPSVVIGGDKDLQQIVGRNVEYYCLNKKCILSRQHIVDRWHVKRPIHVAVALAILGDANDGINGVNQWGPKRQQTAFEQVTEGMELTEVVDTIAAQIPRHELDNFYQALEVTLLRDDIDVADPTPFQFGELDEIDRLGLGHMRPAYSRFVSSFRNWAPVESAVDETEP